MEKKKGAPKGNEFWRLVKMPTGRPRKYTPASLWKEALKYFEWVTKHPLMEKRVFANRYHTKMPKLRAMTETAFCLYAGIDDSTFQRYKSHEDFKELHGVSSTISRIIYTQKFEGAAAEFFNSNIIARDLGLTDKRQIEMDFDKMSDDQLDLIIEKLKNSAKK